MKSWKQNMKKQKITNKWQKKKMQNQHKTEIITSSTVGYKKYVSIDDVTKPVTN